jgi:inhibitor of KinA
MTLSPLGDSAIVMTLGDSLNETLAARVHALAAEINRHRPAAVVDVVPAFATVAVFFDPAHLGDYDRFCDQLKELAVRADASVVSDHVRELEIPVRYGGEFGPDLEECAARHGLSADEVIALHSGATYLVHAIGFVPGFPYLGGLPEKLVTPRRTTPRPLVPAGSVGIGGPQTGIYPIETPGGWNLIGRTPLRLFQPEENPPVLLRAGDRVKFRAITKAEFTQLESAL